MSKAVIKQPHKSGRPKSSLSAMIVPRISARSHRRNRHLGQHPEHGVEPARILGAAGLRQVVARHHPQPRRQGLQQHGHQVRHQQDPDQRIAEPGAAFQVRRPVPRVHVADADQIGRTQETQKDAAAAAPVPAAAGTATDPCTSSSDRRSADESPGQRHRRPRNYSPSRLRPAERATSPRSPDRASERSRPTHAINTTSQSLYLILSVFSKTNLRNIKKVFLDNQKQGIAFYLCPFRYSRSRIGLELK